MMRLSFLLCLSTTDWCKEKKHESADEERVSSVAMCTVKSEVHMEKFIAPVNSYNGVLLNSRIAQRDVIEMHLSLLSDRAAMCESCFSSHAIMAVTVVQVIFCWHAQA